MATPTSPAAQRMLMEAMKRDVDRVMFVPTELLMPITISRCPVCRESGWVDVRITQNVGRATWTKRIERRPCFACSYVVPSG